MRYIKLTIFYIVFPTNTNNIQVTKVNGTDDLWRVFIIEIDIFRPKFLGTSLFVIFNFTRKGIFFRFDLEIIAFLRMLVLLFCYAWVKCDHWLPVAFTTTISTLFVGIKILYFFNKSTGSMPQFLMILG